MSSVTKLGSVGIMLVFLKGSEKSALFLMRDEITFCFSPKILLSKRMKVVGSVYYLLLSMFWMRFV